MTAALGPTAQLEIDTLMADAARELAEAQARGDEDRAGVAQDRLADLADALAHLVDMPRIAWT